MISHNISFCLFWSIQMNVSDGKWNEKRYWEITALVEVSEWKQEAEIIGKNCRDSMEFDLFRHFIVFKY